MATGAPTFNKELEFEGYFFAGEGSKFMKPVKVTGVGSPLEGRWQGGSAVIEAATFEEGLELMDVDYNIRDSEIKNEMGMGLQIRGGGSGSILNTKCNALRTALAFGGIDGNTPKLNLYKVTCDTMTKDPALLISNAIGSIDNVTATSSGEVDISCSNSTIQFSHMECKQGFFTCGTSLVSIKELVCRGFTLSDSIVKAWGVFVRGSKPVRIFGTTRAIIEQSDFSGALETVEKNCHVELFDTTIALDSISAGMLETYCSVFTSGLMIFGTLIGRHPVGQFKISGLKTESGTAYDRFYEGIEVLSRKPTMIETGGVMYLRAAKSILLRTFSSLFVESVKLTQLYTTGVQALLAGVHYVVGMNFCTGWSLGATGKKSFSE
jgi:hypothetical protein